MDEADVIRETVNPFPINRRIGFKGSTYFFNLCLSGDSATINVFMAEETSLNGRYRGSLALGHVPVAELALDVVLSHVNGVRESYRLGRGIAQPKRGVGEPGDEKNNQDKSHDYSYNATGNH